MNIVHEADGLLIVDKPSGVPTQPGESRAVDDLFSQVQRRWPTAALHHRLDQPASGLVLFVLDPRLNKAITQGFREHTITREYLAVFAGDVQSGTWAWTIDKKPSRTDVIALHHGGGFTAARCALHTGRHHQIRIHAAHAGRPILGDRRYGAEFGNWWSRLALHAARLNLVHPEHGGTIDVTSPLPEDLAPLWRIAGG